MAERILYFDLETRLSESEAGLDMASPEFRALSPAEQEARKEETREKLGLSFAATLVSGEDAPALDAATAIVGHGIWRHDFRVLKPYADRLLGEDLFERYRDRTTDLQYMLEQWTGRFLSLDILAHANLGERQLAKSKDMPRLFKEGRAESLQKIKAHLAQNVILTGQIYELGREFGELKYHIVEGGQIREQASVVVDW
jgi:hypothetical protein